MQGNNFGGHNLASYSAKYLTDWTSGEGAISYELFLQQKEFEKSNLAAIDAQTEAIVGSTEQIAEVLHSGLEAGFGEVSRGIDGLRSEMEGVADAVRRGADAINAALYWGFAKLLDSQSRLADSLEQLVSLARTPSQTWALEQFEIARDNERRLLFPEALEAVTRAIDGHASNIGHKTEFRFHLLLGKIRLGNFQNTSADIVSPPAAEKAFLDAARYAKAEFPTECGAALICAGRAAHVQKEFGRAIEHTEAGLAILPKHAHGHYQLARLLCASGRAEMARGPLAKAVRYLPELSIAASREAEFAGAQSMVRNALADATGMLVGVLQHKGAEFNSSRSIVADIKWADQVLSRLSADKLALLAQPASEAREALSRRTVLSVSEGILRLMRSREDFNRVLSGFKADLLSAVDAKQEAATRASSAAIAAINRQKTARKDDIDGQWNSMTVLAWGIGFIAAVVAILTIFLGQVLTSILVGGAGGWLANSVLKARKRPYGDLDQFDVRIGAENQKLQQTSYELQQERNQIERLSLPPNIGVFSAFEDDPPPMLTDWAEDWIAPSNSTRTDGRTPQLSSPAQSPLFANSVRTPPDSRRQDSAGMGAPVLIVIALLVVAGTAIWLTDPMGWSRAPIEESGLSGPTAAADEAGVRTDDEAWEAATGARERGPLDAYLEAFPTGRHADEARAQIAALDVLAQSSTTGELRSLAGDSYLVEAFQPSTQIIVRATGARLREAPFANERTGVIASAQDGEALDVVGRVMQEDGLWYQIRMTAGNVAYIRADLTSAPFTPEQNQPNDLTSASDTAVGQAPLSPTVSPPLVYDTKPVRHRNASMPNYPATSATAKEEGTTTLTACIELTGRVRSVEVTKSSGFPRLDAAAAAWLEAQTFDPATAENRPVEFCGYSMDYQWKLEN